MWKLVLIVAVMSCSGRSSEPEAKPEPEAKQLSCDARMDRFEAALAPVAKETGALLTIPPDIAPIESTKGEPVREYGPVVVVRRDGGVSMNGERLQSIETDLADRLAAEVETMRMMGRSGPLYIWADVATPAATVATIAAAAPDGLATRLALAGPEHTETQYEAALLANPNVAKLRRDTDAVDPSQKAVIVAERVQEAVGLCAPLIRVFGDIAGVEASKKAERMAIGAPAAIRECGCNVADLDMIEYTLLAILGAFDRPIRSIPAAEAASMLAN